MTHVIDNCGITFLDFREIRQMHGLPIHQVFVNVFRDKRCERRHCAGQRGQNAVQRVKRHLVFVPETCARPADVPVVQHVQKTHKFLNRDIGLVLVQGVAGNAHQFV